MINEIFEEYKNIAKQDKRKAMKQGLSYASKKQVQVS